MILQLYWCCAPAHKQIISTGSSWDHIVFTIPIHKNFLANIIGLMAHKGMSHYKLLKQGLLQNNLKHNIFWSRKTASYSLSTSITTYRTYISFAQHTSRLMSSLTYNCMLSLFEEVEKSESVSSSTKTFCYEAVSKPWAQCCLKDLGVLLPNRVTLGCSTTARAQKQS